MTVEQKQYLSSEHQVTGGTGVKERISEAGGHLKEALPDGQAVKSALNGAARQARETLPDPEKVKEEFLAAAHRLQEILPDGDDLKEMVVTVAQEVRDDPDIRRHLESAAEVASSRVQTTVGAGVDAAAGKLREGVEKAGLEDLGYVAERMGEIVKEGVGELVEGTKERALGAIPEAEPYRPGPKDGSSGPGTTRGGQAG